MGYTNLKALISKIDASLLTDPSRETYEDTKAYLYSVLLAAGVPGPDATRLVLTVYWRGWTDGWNRALPALGYQR